MAERDRVLVVGANVAGLSSAIALRRLGADVTVFERHPQMFEVHGGLHIWTNGSQALEWLGAREWAFSHGTALHTVEFRTPDGAVFGRAELEKAIDTYGHPPFFAPRVEISRSLHRIVEPSDVRFASQVTGFTQDADGVTVQLKDGGEERGAVLVGADGLNSLVRPELFPDAPGPRYAGYQDWGAVVPFSHPKFPPGSLRIYWGTGERLGMAHVGEGKVYWAASIKRPLEDTRTPTIEEMLGKFRGYEDPIEELIGATDPETFYGAPIRDLPPRKEWSRGRVILAGDAAHAMEPNLGRGASEALEDGIVLAQQLVAAGDLTRPENVERARTAYESARMKKVYTIAGRSRQMGKLGMMANPAARVGRKLYIRAVFPIVERVMVSDFSKSL